jgi:glycosyltransferase involved in cell wall biosynthesis
MHILHTESSTGWGGQEIRILREAEGMRAQGHRVVLAVVEGGGLIKPARDKGFTVYEVPFTKQRAFKTVRSLLQIIKREQVDLINTHSSLDAWLGGIAARWARIKVIRTRHLSTPIRKGLNSFLLYQLLADYVVTTSSGILPMIQRQARLPTSRLRCIPTGVDPSALGVQPEEIRHFRETLKLKDSDILIGTACFVRSWKGILDFLKAAQLLREHKQLKWVVVGGGYVKEYLPKVQELGLNGIVTFTGHLESPYAAIAAMDVFTLLSTAHEGISQASLQAAYLERPLITTSTGGLPEVCLMGKTGIVVPPFSPEKVAEAVLLLSEDPALRLSYGRYAKELVLQKYTLAHTLKEMNDVYHQVSYGSSRV